MTGARYMLECMPDHWRLVDIRGQAGPGEIASRYGRIVRMFTYAEYTTAQTERDRLNKEETE